MLKKCFIILFLSFLSFLSFICIGVVNAETIYLKNGDVVEGKITSRQDGYIEVDIGIGIDVSYYNDEIDRISNGSPDSDDTYDDSSDYTPPTRRSGNYSSDNIIYNDSDDQEESDENIADEDVEENKAKELLGEFGDKLDPAFKNINKFVGSVKEKAIDYSQDKKPILDKIKATLKEIKNDPKGKLLEYSESSKQAQDILQNKIFPFFETNAKQKLISISIVLWILLLIPVMLIAKRLQVKFSWLIFLPVLQLFIFVKMANKSFLWIIPLLIPGFGFFVFMFFWMEIAGLLQKSIFWGILITLLPGLNYLILWYLALCKTK